MSFPTYERRKRSDVGWLGDVPDHWEVCSLKRIARLKSGEGITSEAIEAEGNYPVYGGNGLRGYASSYTHDGCYVLIGRQGALCGNATERDLVTFEFDGRVLTLTAMGKRTEIVAGGQAWDRPYSVPLIQFRRGIRLNRNELAISIGDTDEVAISIYDTRLQIHRNGISFSEPAGPSA